MTSRFQEVFRLPSQQYIKGGPVIIEAGALQKDEQTGKILAQIKIKNISPNIIVGCKVFIRAFELSGAELQGIDSFSYLDISVARGGDFGTKVPVFLPNDLTRKFSVAVTEVLFNDNTMWKSDPVEWKSIPKQNRIESVLQDTDLTEEYKIEAGDNAEYYPEISNGLFLCTCGNINMDASSPCFRCHRKYDALMHILDAEKLSNNRKERLEKERQKKEKEEQLAALIEAEKKEKKQGIKKRIKRIFIVAIPSILLAGVIFFVANRYIRPEIDRIICYRAAIKYMNEKNYNEAEKIFALLGDYKDSEDQVKEVSYRKADDLYQEGNYDAAIDTWKTIIEYSDSKDRITMAENDILEEKYQAAVSLMDAKKYIEAAKAFDELGGYKDSKDKNSECLNNMVAYIKQVDYNNLTNEEYEQSISYFKVISNDDALTVAYYKYGRKKIDDKDYENASYYLQKAVGYEDAEDWYLNATYTAACQNFDNKNYIKAVNEFEKCLDYKDSLEKILEAKYAYVCAHKYDPDVDTENYTRQLAKVDYKDSKDIYDQIFQWKITVIAINDSESSNTDMDSVSRQSTIYVHTKLEGGEQGESTKIKCVTKWPDGGKTISYSSNKWGRGYTGTWSFWYNNPSYGTTGQLSVTFYDDKGNEIGSGSVRITY